MNSKYIKNYSLSLGDRVFDIPYYTQDHSVGLKVLITAGMDGDEYTGVEAAYEIINIYRKKPFPGRISVLPLVNIPGFEAQVSWNPQDGLYPKNIFPGSKYGRPTEKLIYWLYENFIRKTDIWLDLHGGASFEELAPCILSSETQDELVNKRTLSVLGAVSAENVVYEKRIRWQKARQLARDKCSYIIFESGDRGRCAVKDVRRHVDWVIGVLQAVVTQNISDIAKTRFVYCSKHTFIAPGTGVWQPEKHAGDLVARGDRLGMVISDGRVRQLNSSVSGLVLWNAIGIEVIKGDEIITIASD